jgi:hypothetical protein
VIDRVVPLIIERDGQRQTLSITPRRKHVAV